LIATLAVRIRRQETRNAHPVGVQVMKRDQNILHVDPPPAHVVRKEAGAKSQREARRDEVNRIIHQTGYQRRV